jgi:hypothetical protein
LKEFEELKMFEMFEGLEKVDVVGWLNGLKV